MGRKESNKQNIYTMPPSTDDCIYTTFANFSMKYHLMFKIYTDVGGIK